MPHAIDQSKVADSALFWRYFAISKVTKTACCIKSSWLKARPVITLYLSAMFSYPSRFLMQIYNEVISLYCKGPCRILSGFLPVGLSLPFQFARSISLYTGGVCTQILPRVTLAYEYCEYAEYRKRGFDLPSLPNLIVQSHKA